MVTLIKIEGCWVSRIVSGVIPSPALKTVPSMGREVDRIDESNFTGTMR